jgi:hypothetical protein
MRFAAFFLSFFEDFRTDFPADLLADLPRFPALPIVAPALSLACANG